MNAPRRSFRVLASCQNIRTLVGYKIVAVEPQPFPDGRGGTAHKPVLVLDDGRRVKFLVDETETDYGVNVVVARPLMNKPKARR
jgi:hypothetical protein